jgi:hypothetical protein
MYSSSPGIFCESKNDLSFQIDSLASGYAIRYGEVSRVFRRIAPPSPSNRGLRKKLFFLKGNPVHFRFMQWKLA